LVRIRIGEDERELDWDDWEQRVRDGRVPPDALVAIEAITEGDFVEARTLESYQSLRNEAALRWQSRFTAGPAPLLTAALVGINVRIWWLARLPGPRHWLDLNFTDWAAPLFEDGESWRAVTMGLLHIGLPHLAMNMLWLAYTGWNLERALGRINVLVIYTSAVIGGSLLSAWLSPESRSLGASGGVFGLVAAAVVFGFVRTDILPSRGRRVFGLALFPYLVVMFLSGLVNEGIDNWSHFGGLLTGALLALVLDPVPLQRRPGWDRIWWAGLSALGGATLLGIALLGPRLEPLESHQAARERLMSRVLLQRPDEDAGRYDDLAWDAPAGWRLGVTASGETGFVSPSPRGDRAWAVQEDIHDAPVDPASLALAWTEQVLEVFPDARVGRPTPATLSERPALTVRVVLDQPDDILQWWGTTRGMESVTAVWQIDGHRERRLAPLARRLVAHVAWGEPEDLVQAKAEVQRNPRTRVGRADLAKALARMGKPDQAVDLYRTLMEEEPHNPDWVAGLLQVASWYPHAVPDVDGVRDDALAGDPTPASVVTVVRSFDDADEPEAAAGLLELAWDRWPGDRLIRKARRRHGMPVDLDGATSLPRSLAVDPDTGRPRTQAQIDALVARPLDAATARRVGAERAQRRARWAQEALEALARDPKSAVDPLLRLQLGAPPEDLDAAVAGLVEDLRTLDRRGHLPWMPDGLADSIRAADLLGPLGGRDQPSDSGL